MPSSYLRGEFVRPRVRTRRGGTSSTPGRGDGGGRRAGRGRRLAPREYALGVEAVTRLVAGEPPWRLHEADFGVLAMESAPVDPAPVAAGSAGVGGAG